MNIGDFRDAILSFPATPWWKSIGMFEGAARRITSAGRLGRKRAEEALRESEERYRDLVENSRDLICTHDLDGLILSANRAALEMLGSSSDSYQDGTNLREILAPEVRDQFGDYLKRIRANGVASGFMLVQTKTGERRIWEYHNTLRTQGVSAPIVRGMARDITEQRRVEEALRESERFRRMIIESEPECVKVVAPDYTLLDMNPAGLKMIEATSREQVIGQSVLNLIAPQCRTAFMGMHERVCHGESLVTEFEIIGLKGSRRWMESHAAPLLDKESRVIAQLAITLDITERKYAEEGLRQSERQLAEAQRVAHIGSWSWDLNSEAQIWSDELYRICGLQPGQVAPTYEAFLELVNAEDRLPLGESIEHAVRTREPIDLYFRIIRADGEERIIHSRGRVVYDDLGNPIRNLGTAQDVTESRRAEEALRAAEQKYRDIFENAAEGIFQTTPDGRFVSANPALVKMFGFSSPAELIRERADISNQHYVDPKCHEEFKRRLDEQGVVKDFEYQGYRRDGSTIWLSENVRTVRDERGEVLYYEGTTQDITERRLANQSLRLFRTLIDQSSDAIEVMNPNTLRFIDCNESAYHDLGYTREEFLSLSVYDIDPLLDEKRAARLIEEIDRSGFVIFESIHRRKDGSTFPVEVNLKIVRLERDYRLAVVRDITERKLAEEALGQAEEKYRRIFENAGEGIFQSTPDGRLIAANPALARMYGFGSIEETIKSRQDISRQLYVDLKRREEFKLQIEEQDSVRGFEHQVFRKDGSKIWISANAHAVRDAQGGIQYYEGTVQDITDRKLAEDELIKQKEILEKIVDHIPVMINFTDGDGRLKLINREWQKRLGWSLEDLSSQELDVFAQCYPDPKYRQQVLDFIAAATGEWKDFKTRTKSGTMIDTSWARVKLSDGTTIGIGSDITDRKRAEEKLQNSEKYFRSLIENASDLITIADGNGIIRYESPSLERMLGYKPEERIGKSVLDLLHPDDLPFAKRHFAKGIRNPGIVHVMECRFQHKDGSWHLLETTGINLLDDPVVAGIVVNSRDITKRKRAEEALRSYPRRLIEAQEAERQHIARELHDQIGQVLTAVRINLHTIGNSCETAESRSLISQGRALIDGALEQVRNLSFELRPSLLDNLGLVAALRWYSDQYTQRTGIQARSVTNLPGGGPRLRQELETACFRIVQEALTNVVRHANAKNVSISLRRLDQKIVLSIKDDGIGFDQLSPNGGASAIRLGLTGMKERALALGGTLEIESAPAQGTEIRAWFPTSSNED